MTCNTKKKGSKTLPCGTPPSFFFYIFSPLMIKIYFHNLHPHIDRYIELTDEEKDKLKSSAKVAKKLEKLENLGQDRDLSSDDEDNDYPSMDSDVPSPRNSEPTSLTESMQLVDSILSDNKIDKLDKLNKLEEILSAATLLQNESEPSSGSATRCSCNCHTNKAATLNRGLNEGKIVTASSDYKIRNHDNNAYDINLKENHCNVETQTLSTGDIVVTKIYFNETPDWSLIFFFRYYVFFFLFSVSIVLRLYTKYVSFEICLFPFFLGCRNCWQFLSKICQIVITSNISKICLIWFEYELYARWETY